MKTSITLTLATLLAISTVGCANRPFRNILHRGAACGTASAVPTSLPVVSDATSYSPGCGIGETCPTCGTLGGPLMYEGGYPIDGTTIPMPEPQ